jgi:protein subunit release factor A
LQWFRFVLSELAEDAAGDKEMMEMAAEEAKDLEQQIKDLEERLKVLLRLEFLYITAFEETLRI